MVGETVSVCHIQHDFEATGVGSQFFINVDKSLDEIQEFKIKKLPDDQGWDAGKENSFQKIGHHLYRAVLNHKQYNFCTMNQDYTSNFNASDKEADWAGIDIIASPEKRYALGDTSGNIMIYDGSLKLQKEMLGAHLGEITSLKFFPSGEVLLSSSTDTKIKLWSLVDWSNPRTFQGHKGSITQLCMIDRGRNFLSSSTDGSVCLWECGSGQKVFSFSRKENPNDGINAIDLLSQCVDTDYTPSSPLEFHTKGKHVVAGHSSGVVTLHDLYSKEQQLQLPSKFMCSCNTLKVDTKDNNYIYAGYQNGMLSQWDLRQPTCAVDSISINEGTPINSIFLDSSSMYISSGVDTSLSLNIDEPERRMQYQMPMFLVSNDYQVSQFAADPEDADIIAVGNWGFRAKFKTLS
ncbi:hypothetical protein HG535_0E03850 [Zygotorulaspora mrakii]|uniref:Uncharacterized protein n=1 Tax=Zygotorulaspora mrakii TaxID=42260 RepID=A0A7H9B3S3_ZYGMR|nr:uncharacterized protein HG535_0E03850 [Zygotorulaspora mrakii]QLG73301.1 hypothetical protein HG535_0E03850 [Zygotorulaspora mrakii]